MQNPRNTPWAGCVGRVEVSWPVVSESHTAAPSVSVDVFTPGKIPCVITWQSLLCAAVAHIRPSVRAAVASEDASAAATRGRVPLLPGEGT